MHFTSDNTSGAHPAILQALVNANGHGIAAYGEDPMTQRVQAYFNTLFQTDTTVFFVTTGTAANAIALASAIPPWGNVLCHAEAHIIGDECGAPEFYTHGGKIRGLDGLNAKVSPATLEHAVSFLPAHAVSISQATESGTVYTIEEIKAISAFCRQQRIPLHMDGARFANALVALGCTPAEMTWKSGVDILSFGGTKNGCLIAEAIVVFRKDLADTITERRKRGGQTLSKQWQIAAQYDAYLTDDLWLENARTANAAAKKLSEGFTQAGIRLAWPTEANEVFAFLPEKLDAALRAGGAHYHHWQDTSLPATQKAADGEKLARFVCSFVTTEEEVSQVLSLLA